MGRIVKKLMVLPINLCKKVTPNPQPLKFNLSRYSRAEGMGHLITIYSIFHHTLTYMDATLQLKWCYMVVNLNS